MQLWQEGGAGRVGLHALVGGLTGGVDGARGAASSAVVAPQTVDMLQALGVPPEMSRILVPLAGAAVGYGTGGVGGAATGFNEADNNASGSIARRAAVPMLQLCSSSVQCAAFFGSAAGVAGGGALLNQISNRAADLQTRNPNLTDNAAFVMALSERTAGAFVGTVTSWFAPTPASGPSTTTSPGTPLPPPAPLVTPANAPAPAGSNSTAGTQLDQPQQPTGTPGRPVAAPVAGSNMTATPMAQPQGPGIVISQQAPESPARAPDFEESLVRLPPNERVPVVRTTLGQIAAENGWVKDQRLSRINDRDVYVAPDGSLFSVDTQHGRFEGTNSRGVHLGEYNIDIKPIPNSRDPSGRHNLRVK